MQESKRRLRSLFTTLALVALNLVAINVLIAGWNRARVDMTEDGLYSITPVTRQALASLDQDVTIYGYFSKKTHPKLAPLVPQIEDLLEEYASVSDGRVKVEIVDPAEYEQVEREANERFGVKSTPFQLTSKYEAGIVNAYFALVIRYGDQYEKYEWSDLVEIEPLPDGDAIVRLRNLEYDLTRAIRKVRSNLDRNLDLFASIEGPVKLTAIMTPKTLPEIFAGVPEAIRAAAKEIEEKGGDKFVFEEIDPSSNENVEQRVRQQFGARPMTLGVFGGDPFYLYGILQIGDSVQQISLARDSISAADIREAIEQSIRRQTPGFLETVGIVSPDPSIPPEILAQLQMQGRMPQMPPPEFEEVKRYLERDYTVKSIALDTPVPYDVSILVVLKPRSLEETALFNLDQYLMRGGRVIICAGQYDVQFSRTGLSVTPLTTGLDDWLKHFGVTVRQSLVLDDVNQPLPIPEVRSTPFGNVQTWVMAPYPYLVQVDGDGFTNRDIAGSLPAMGIYWGSPIETSPQGVGALQLTTLLQTSERSWTDTDVSRVQFVDYEVPEETSRNVLGVALSGRFKSFFEGKPAPVPEPAEGDEAPAATPTGATLEQSPETRLVVIGNAEFLSDLVARSLGASDSGFFAENLRYMENLIDWTLLDNDMIAIRSRGAGARRLERTERPEQIGIEVASYVIPVAILAALALWQYWKRRKPESMFTTTSEVKS